MDPKNNKIDKALVDMASKADTVMTPEEEAHANAEFRWFFLKVFFVLSLIGKFIFGYSWFYVIFATLSGPIAYHVLAWGIWLIIFTITMLWVHRGLLLAVAYLAGFWGMCAIGMEHLRCDLHLEWVTELIKGGTMPRYETDSMHYQFHWGNVSFFFAVPFVAVAILFKNIMNKLGGSIVAGAGAGSLAGWLAGKHASKR